VGRIRSADRPREEDVEALLARKEESDAYSVLTVIPGMAREEAEELLGAEHPGIDVIYTDGKVSKVYLRQPLEGPFFGIELGASFRKRTRETDLVFDTVIEPVAVEGALPRILTMLSHTLKGLVVKLFVADTDEILAMEIAAR
jgi:hypothetical protein